MCRLWNQFSQHLSNPPADTVPRTCWECCKQEKLIISALWPAKYSNRPASRDSARRMRGVFHCREIAARDRCRRAAQSCLFFQLAIPRKRLCTSFPVSKANNILFSQAISSLYFVNNAAYVYAWRSTVAPLTYCISWMNCERRSGEIDLKNQNYK